VFKKLPLYVPLFLKKIVDGFGFFKYNGASYRPLDVAFVAFNSFAHAVGNSGQNELPANLTDRDFIVNTRYVGWQNALLRRYATIYNLWAQTTRAALTIMPGMVIQAPVVNQGFATLVGLPNNAWQQPIPPEVQRALGVAVAVEGLLGGGNLDQAWINAVRVFGVVIVGWTRDVQEALANDYTRNHQAIIEGLMGHMFDASDEEIRFTQEGSAAQLVNVGRGGSISTYPFEIPMGNIEQAIILSNRTGYLIDPQQIESASAQSGNTARDLYVKAHLKGGAIV
jgi:hypothetical protein